MTKKKRIVAGCLAAVLIAGTAGKLILGRNAAAAASVQFTEAEAVRQDLRKSIQGTGVLLADNVENVQIPTGIKVEEVKVRAGSSVKAGTILAVVDGDSVQAELLEAKEEIARLEKSINAAAKKDSAYYTQVKNKKDLEEKRDILEKIAQNNAITAPADGSVTAVNISAGNVQNKSGGQTNAEKSNDKDSGTPKETNGQKISALEGFRVSAGITLYRGTAANSGYKMINLSDGTGEQQDVCIEAFPKLDIKAPEAGKKPYTGNLETEIYVARADWDPQTEVFEPDTKYTAKVRVIANPGYYFKEGLMPELEGAEISNVEYLGEDEITEIHFLASFPSVKTEEKEPGTTETGTKEEETKGTESSDTGASNVGPQKAETEQLPGNTGIGGDMQAGAGAIEFAGGISAGSIPAGGASAEGSAKEVNTELMSAFTIAADNKMTVEIQVDEMDILSIKEGQKARISLNSMPGSDYEGEISYINRIGNANNGVTKYTVKITVPRDENMLWGMNVSAEVIAEKRDGVLTVPVSAITEEGNKSYVYISLDEKTGALKEKKEVETGLSDGTNVEIIKGVKEGQKIYYEETEPVQGNTEEEMMM